MAADNPYPSWGDRRNLHACWICLIAAEPLQAPRLQPTYAYAPRRDWAGPSTVVFYGRSLRSQLPLLICWGSTGINMGCRKDNTLARRRSPLMLYVEQSRFDVFAPGLLLCPSLCSRHVLFVFHLDFAATVRAAFQLRRHCYVQDGERWVVWRLWGTLVFEQNWQWRVNTTNFLLLLPSSWYSNTSK